MKKLPVLCPQLYDGVGRMQVVGCNRCHNWVPTENACHVEMGVEHLPLVVANEVPACPMAAQCQHQIQQVEPCPVRARGLICESALKRAGVKDPWDHPLSFNADTVIEPEDMMNCDPTTCSTCGHDPRVDILEKVAREAFSLVAWLEQEWAKKGVVQRGKTRVKMLKAALEKLQKHDPPGAW